MTVDPLIPYGRQQLDDDDIAAVTAVLRSDWLTTGPKIAEFEQAVAKYVGVRSAVAVTNGTAALHSAMFAIDVGPGDEVIVPSMTFAATANAVVYQGGTPVFADVDPDTLLIDISHVEALITCRTKAVIAVDYAGQPCDYELLRKITQKHGIYLISDASHSLGAKYKGQFCGTLADLTTFSFHPVKPITTGEGGMVVTGNVDFAERIQRFRNHGISIDHHKRMMQGRWHYEISELGYNYRLSDLQAALGLSQLKKLKIWINQRRCIAEKYLKEFSSNVNIRPLQVLPEVDHGFHLFVVRVPATIRTEVFSRLRDSGIGVNVHYLPVHMHPFYRRRFGTFEGQCPVAEQAYLSILSLPIYPGMDEKSLIKVSDGLVAVLSHCGFYD